MDDTTVKKVMITGSAAGSLTPAGFEEAAKESSKTKQKSRKREKLHVKATMMGAGTHPGTLVQLASTHVPGDDSRAVGVTSDLTEQGAKVGAIAPSVGGGTSVSVGDSTSESKNPEPKIVLSKTRKKSKIILAAKPTIKHKENPTKRKTIKKVKMSIKGLTRKMKKAHTIRNDATGKSIEEIKKKLIQMQLVKPDTTAPEDVLRQIYLDVETMKKRAL